MADNKSFESTLHDIVYSIDTGTGLKIIRVTLYVLILLIVVMIYTATQFRGLKTEEAMDYAQLGRNISLQNGMVTKYVRPLSMWKMASLDPNENPRIQNHPDLFHPPAYPTVLSLGYNAVEVFGIDPFETEQAVGALSMGAEQWIILSINNLFAILTGWMIFLLGKRLFSREIGLVGMTIYYLSDLVWGDSITGLNVSMAIFFVMASFYSMIVAMLNKRDGEPKARWITPYLLSIICAAIAFLTRYIAIAVVPGVCLFAWLMAGRFRGGTRFVIIFVFLYALMISPWLLRNYKVCGNPMGMTGYTALMDTREYPDTSLSRNLEPEIVSTRTMDVLEQKWNINYTEKHRYDLPAMGGSILMAFFLVTFFYHFIRPQVNYLRWGIGLSLLLTAFIAGYFSDSSFRMLHAFWPFVILYALAFFYILIDRLDLGVRLYNIGLKLLIVFLATLPFWLRLMPPHERKPYPPYHVEAIANVSELLNPNEVMCTDMAWATAWYGDRVSILLPANLDQFYEINDLKQYISGLYITTLTKDKPFITAYANGPESSWWAVMNGSLPPDFPLKEGLQIIRQDQIFYSDRRRWENRAAPEGQ